MSVLTKYNYKHTAVLEPEVCPGCGQALPHDDVIRVDLLTNSVTHNGKAVYLRPRCAELLHILAETYPRTASYRHICERMFGVASDVENEYRNVVVHIFHLRKFLKEAELPYAVNTVWSKGLQLVKTNVE